MSELLIGIDLGGTAIKCGVVDSEGRMLGRDARACPASEGVEAVVDEIVAGVESALAAAGKTLGDVSAAGAGAPGPMDWRTGVVFAPPNLAGWKDVPLGALLRERLGVPCFVDNDANLACYGEFKSGAGRGVETMCLLTLGTGVGGGIVVFGRLLRGIDGTAAEIGHLKVARDGRACGCGGSGCLEAYGSVSAMLRTVQEGIDAGRETSLSGRELTGEIVSEAAENGDVFAREVLEDTGRWLGLAVASLVNLLNPERVVLTGGMANAGDLLFDPIRRTVDEEAFEVPARRVRIVPGELGGNAGVLGAAAIALDRIRAGE